MIYLKRIFSLLFLLFILPALLSLAVWQADASKPVNWHSANWASAGILPPASENPQAVVHVMAARTGRWKGAFSVHSWIVFKRQNASRYERFDVVGWGTPVRQNAWAPDGRWYSNEPKILYSVEGEKADNLIPKIEAAIQAYPEDERGDYRAWPGPNSNSFVAHILNEVPELGISLPPNAVGRDWMADGSWVKIDPDYQNVQMSFAGFAGLAVGKRHGFELNFLGLVTGIDFHQPALKLPGFGRLEF